MFVGTWMIHLNGNLLCVIDCETTGLVPGFHDLIQVCFMPLGFDLKPHKKHIPFELKIQPQHPENIDLEALKKNHCRLMDYVSNGLPADRAADLFDDWCERLHLPEGKRISPLGHNWIFDKSFIQEWLGPYNFEYRIDGRYRDSMVTALYLNDQADFNVEQCPFPKVALDYVASQCGVAVEGPKLHDAIYDCMLTGEVYRKMVQRGVLI